MSIPVSEVLKPGDVIEFGDITQLPEFEDLVAMNMFPDMTQIQLNAWKGRAGLRDIIRPPKFNGTISDIQLEVMADPYQQLMTARDRGWTFPTSRPSPRTNEFAQDAEISSEGFVFTANAKSSGVGVVGQIQTEIWYVPVPRYARSKAFTTLSGKINVQSRGVEQLAQQNGGAVVQRHVAKPKIDTAAFIELDARSKIIGFAVLQYQMMHAITLPTNL
jgi:hypothetical protein